MRILLAVAVQLAVFNANAQETASWVGQKVVLKYDYPIKVGDQVVPNHEFHIFTVQRVKGDWLWVTWSSVEGWIPASQAVLFDQATNFYTQEIAANKGNAVAWALRGVIWREKTEYDLAIADFNEAIRLDPASWKPYISRGNTWQRKKDYDKALADYNEAIRLVPTEATAYNDRGIVWDNKKDYDKAIADFSQAIRLDPKDAVAYNNRGNAWKDKEKYDKAIADFNEAIRLDPKIAAVYNNRGIAYGAEKEYDKAIADYSQAIRLDPKIAAFYSNRGAAWRAKKAYDKAIVDYNEAVRLDPTNARRYNSPAWLWATCPDQGCRDGMRAVEFATRACELSAWKVAIPLNTLAAAYAEAGDFAKAVEWQEKTNNLYFDAEDRRKGEDRLKLYKQKKPYRDEQ